eukprot:scaffold36476_cov252-Amphora_coffeaeformis.AAC.9
MSRAAEVAQYKAMVGVGLTAHMVETLMMTVVVARANRWTKFAVSQALDEKFKSTSVWIWRNDVGKHPISPVVPAQLTGMALEYSLSSQGRL